MIRTTGLHGVVMKIERLSDDVMSMRPRRDFRKGIIDIKVLGAEPDSF